MIDNPRGQTFDVNRNLLPLRTFATSFTKFSYIDPEQGLANPWGRNFDVNRNILSRRSFVAKNLFEVWFYIFFFMILYMYIAPGQGQLAPGDKGLMSTKTSCHFIHLWQVKKKSLHSLILYNCFNYLIHVYSTRVGADSPQGTKFWCQQNRLVTSFICYKFQKHVFEVWFYTICFMILYIYIAPGRGRQLPGDNILMSTERPYHFTHLFPVSKDTLWRLILYNFVNDLIHVYSPGAGARQLAGDKVLMSTETSCHFSHLLPVSNHRRQ